MRLPLRVLSLFLTPLTTTTPPTVLAHPTGHATDSRGIFHDLSKRENLCHLTAPPVLCTPNASVTVEETAQRAYQFYRAFVVDGDPRTMFSLIDNVYKVCFELSHY